MNQLRWTFEPVDWMSLNESYYYIANVKYNEYLCASQSFGDSAKKRRIVQLEPMSRELLATNKKCMWRAEQLNNQNDQFYLWNVHFKESFYAATSFKLYKKSDRKVFLWHKEPDSDQFVWFVYCSKSYVIEWNRIVHEMYTLYRQ